MIALTPQLPVLVATAPADFRQGIDDPARRVRQVLADEPLSGALFVFRNRRGTAIKLLVYDGQGCRPCRKRLSQGRFRHWPSGAPGQVPAPKSWRYYWPVGIGAPRRGRRCGGRKRRGTVTWRHTMV